MTSGWITPAYIRSVAIVAGKVAVLIDGYQLLAHILTQAVFVVALAARCYWHVGFQAAQGCRFSNVDMTGSALGDVLLATMPKLQ